MIKVTPLVELIKKLQELSPSLQSTDNSAARSQASQIVKELSAHLVTPTNAAVDLAFAPFLTVAARVAVNLDIFRIIANHNGPINSIKLAEATRSEELLIIRILRPLAAVGFVLETGEREWESTPITQAMATEEIAAGHRMIGEMIVGAAQRAPKFLQEYGNRCPTDPNDGLMQYAFQTKLTTFELFNTMPSVMRDFNLFMGNTMGSRSYWVDWYPVQKQLLQDYDPSTTLLVDVGAGKGHDLIAFHEKYPGIGPVVLQDLPAVTSSIGALDPAIEVMEYNFYLEQPIEGARTYFYHHILHDWSDERCLQILHRVKAAMLPRYSKLLIHEMIVPEVGASVFHAMLDMTMMAFNAGMERTERQWVDLLEKVGLEVLNIWPPMQEDADGIIEAWINS